MSKKELIQAYIVRNDDAKDYAKEITRLQKKFKDLELHLELDRDDLEKLMGICKKCLKQ